MGARMLTLEEVAEELAISKSQSYALVRRWDLRALKVGGRGAWRVERSELEAFIARLYEETAQWVSEHPFAEEPDVEDPEP
jgi:excisionase family DNA binding protein